MAEHHDWRIDDDGSLRTPSGMKVARLTPDGDIEVMDRVVHQRTTLSLAALMAMWRAWRNRQNSADDVGDGDGAGRAG